MVTTFKNFIGGKWVSSSSKETFANINPATEKTINKFQKSTKYDVQNAIESAQKASKKWRDVPAPHRGLILLRAAQLMRKEKERLARLMTIEMGKPLFETRGDVQEAIDIAEYMAGEGRRLFGFTTPSELPKKMCLTTRMPLGVVGLITPWNFPIAIPAWKLMPALICGNAVVFKPASDTPQSTFELVSILVKAGLPKDVVNIVTGSGQEVGMEIVKSKKIHALSFTGNKKTGETILQNAGIKKTGLELGGKNCVIVMPDADLNLVVDGIIWGGFGTTGQRCTATSRVIVHKSIKQKLVNTLIARTKKLRVGNGLRSTTEMGPLINKKAQEKSAYYTDVGKKEGAKLLIGGKQKTGQGFFFEPTIFSNVTKNMRIAQEEIFGPIISILEFSSLDQAITIANSIEYGLSSSIYTQNITPAFEALNRLETGITYVNSSTIGAEAHLPFGGMKGTGNGTREAGWTGIDEFSEIKTIYIDYSGKLQRAQID